MCRICMVSIKGETKLQPACVTKVKEGMQVDTRTEEVVKNVKFVLELLRSTHPYACSTCDADGTCKLQDFWYRYQVSKDNIPPGVEKVYQQHHEWDTCPVETEVSKKAGDDYTSHDSFNAIQFDIEKVRDFVLYVHWFSVTCLLGYLGLMDVCVGSVSNVGVVSEHVHNYKASVSDTFEPLVTSVSLCPTFHKGCILYIYFACFLLPSQEPSGWSVEAVMSISPPSMTYGWMIPSAFNVANAL